jgi:hypothetical protein
MYHLETREWRDTTYGNSYASARLFLDYGDRYELVAVFPFQYGRGYDFGHAVHDIVNEMPLTHSREVLKREAKAYGDLTTHEAITFTPYEHPSYRVWVEPFIIGLGTCDICHATYDLRSRDGRCGDCGNCADHCDHDTLPCQTCGTPVPADIHAEELGFCQPCQADYFDHEGDNA